MDASGLSDYRTEYLRISVDKDTETRILRVMDTIIWLWIFIAVVVTLGFIYGDKP